jgi:hypothetical protein
VFDVSFDDPDNTDFGGQYPSADVAAVFSQGGTTQIAFYEFLSDGVYLVGAEVVGITSQPYTNSRRELSTPMTYLDSYQDSAYFVSTTNGFESLGASSYDVEVDGYGTLITPQATYEDVLRLRIVENLVITLEIGGQVISETITEIETYSWMIDEFPYPVMLISESTTNGISSTASRYISGDALNVFSADKQLDRLKAFPVPAVDELNIDLGSNEISNGVLRVFDLKGAVVMEQNIQRNAGVLSLNVAPLRSGFYTVQISSDTGIGYVRFTK